MCGFYGVSTGSLVFWPCLCCRRDVGWPLNKTGFYFPELGKFELISGDSLYSDSFGNLRLFKFVSRLQNGSIKVEFKL